MEETWRLCVLLTATALRYRDSGDGWLVTITKLTALVVLAVVAVTVLGGFWLRFG